MIRKFTKKVINILDNHFKINLYGKAVRLEDAYYSSNALNAIRRNINPALVRWRYKFGIKDKNPLRLHLGCGDRHFEGYRNIDRRKTRATDLVCDIRKLPYRDNSAELIETYHVIEHLPRHDLPKALKEWYRILMPGAKLVIECPDFDKNARDYLEGVNPDMNLLYIYGRQRFAGDVHYFGYNFERLKDILEETGFTNIERKDAQDSHTREAACLRVECIRTKGN